MLARAAIVPLVLLASVLAGCTGSRYDVEAAGSDVRIIDGFSYDGSRVRMGAGSLTLQLNSAKDTGRVLASVVDLNKQYEVVFNQFAGDQPYHDGGVHRDFFEHGDTGNGSTEFPKFFAYVAAWGTATVRLNGEVNRDPRTLENSWKAHVMVVQGHVRDPTSGAVYKSDGRGFYDPNTPADGFVNRTGAQAILQLKTAANDLVYHFEFEEVRLTKY